MNISDMKIGNKYNWKHSPEKLVYLGNNWSGNGYWHQFAKVETPELVWCEVLDADLRMIEDTVEKYIPETKFSVDGGLVFNLRDRKYNGRTHQSNDITVNIQAHQHPELIQEIAEAIRDMLNEKYHNEVQ